MDKNDPGQERAVTDKALSYSFDVDPNAGKIINARVPLLAQDMVIKPESFEVNGTRTEIIPDTIHITFNGNVPDSSLFVHSFRIAFPKEIGINGKELTLTAKTDGINKDMVGYALFLLHKHKAISTNDVGEAAKKFGVESLIDVASPRVEMDKPADPAFMERVFPRVNLGIDPVDRRKHTKEPPKNRNR